MCPTASGAVTSTSGRPAALSLTTGSSMQRSGKALSAFRRIANSNCRPPMRLEAMGGIGGVRLITPLSPRVLPRVRRRGTSLIPRSACRRHTQVFRQAGEPTALPTVELSIKYSKSVSIVAFLVAAGLVGCHQLGGAKKANGPTQDPSDDQAKRHRHHTAVESGSGGPKKAMGPREFPWDEQLKKISYMTEEESGPQGRKVYTHFWEAKTCSDFETAMRWNRPRNVAGGSFGQKMVYLTDTVPADLPE